MVLEVIGSMLITFLYLTQTEEKTKMSSDPAITTLIISATYTAVVSAAALSKVITSSPFNPASALGIFFSILFNGEMEQAKGLWVFFFFAYGGSLLAVFLFEFVCKKAMQPPQCQHDGEPVPHYLVSCNTMSLEHKAQADVSVSIIET